jgi:antitoxin MazE
MYMRSLIMQVAKWGNSLAIRLPAAVVEALDLREGDDITLHAAGRRTLEIEKAPGATELLARLRKYLQHGQIIDDRLTVIDPFAKP